MGNEVVVAPDLTSVTIRGKIIPVVIGPDGSIRIGNRLFGPPPADGQTMQYGGASGGGGGAGGSGGHPKQQGPQPGPPKRSSSEGSPGIHVDPFFWGGKWKEYDEGAHGFHGEPVGRRKVAQEGGKKRDNGKAGRRRGPRPPRNSNQ